MIFFVLVAFRAETLRVSGMFLYTQTITIIFLARLWQRLLGKGILKNGGNDLKRNLRD